MKSTALLHIPDSPYCFAENGNTAVLRLRVNKDENPLTVNVLYGCKYEIARKQSRAKMEKSFTDGLFDYYTARLILDDVRLVYVFEIIDNQKTFYYSEDGLTSAYDFTQAYFNSFQLPYINQADIHSVVPWMREAVFYQVFIDRFNRADYNKDDSYINLKCGEKPHYNSFAGGDIKGITEKLDYFADMGINALYLTPVFCSVSNHKYNISDYYNIDKQFGDNNALRELIDKAHKQKIRIMLDAVFNHCGEQFPQFQDVIKNGRKSPYYNWFIIRGEKPEPKKLNYECFASCSFMPKFDTSNSEVQNFLCDIAVHWIKEYDIDGWRLDVSDEVSHDFWRLIRKSVKKIKPDCVIIGENWHDASPFLRGEQFDGIMNYAFTRACLDFFASEKLTAKEYAERLNGLLMRNTDMANEMMLNFLDTHDTQRFLTSAGGNVDKLLCAIAAAFFYKGAPCIYYGTEIALTGGPDPDCRRVFDWALADKNNKIRRCINDFAMLKKREELQKGSIKIYALNENVILERACNGNTLRLIIENQGLSFKLEQENSG